MGWLLSGLARSSPSPKASDDFLGFYNQHMKTDRGADNDALQAACAYRLAIYVFLQTLGFPVILLCSTMDSDFLLSYPGAPALHLLLPQHER